MASIVLIKFKNTTKLNSFIKDADGVFRAKGLVPLSVTPRTYFSLEQIPEKDIKNAISMIKKSEYYLTCVENIFYSTTLKIIK